MYEKIILGVDDIMKKYVIVSDVVNLRIIRCSRERYY